MDGFSLFQDKIIGQGNNKKGADPKILFYQQESMPTDPSYLLENEIDFLKFGSFGDSNPSIFEEDFYESYPDSLSTIDFKIEYSETQTETLEDFRDVLCNFNNGISSQNKKTMIVFFD